MLTVITLALRATKILRLQRVLLEIFSFIWSTAEQYRRISAGEDVCLRNPVFKDSIIQVVWNPESTVTEGLV
jgi:hypothetical protein